jgi:hypothetical protein
MIDDGLSRPDMAAEAEPAENQRKAIENRHSSIVKQV